MTLKVYVAAPWTFKEQAKGIKKTLEQAGFVVTSRWIDLHVEKPQSPAENGWSEATAEIMTKEAGHDLEDVRESDVLLLFNIQPRGQETTGKAVETGIALSMNKPVLLIGERTNVFHYLKSVFLVPDLNGAIGVMKNWALFAGAMKNGSK